MAKRKHGKTKSHKGKHKKEHRGKKEEIHVHVHRS